MKIDPQRLESVFLHPKADNLPSGQQPGKSENFAALLADMPKPAFSPTPSKNDDSAASLLSGALIGQLQAGQAVGQKSDSAVDEMSQLLSILEEYATALDDPEKTLKDIAPLAEDMGRRGDYLNKLSLGLPQGDPLKALTSETAVLATVESMKFKRGDFV